MTTTQHYSAADARTSWLSHAIRLPQLPRDLWERRSLLWNFFRRDLLGRFRGSALGLLWVLILPVFMFAVYFAIFGVLFGPRGDAAAGPNSAFAIYLFCGIITFGLINESTSSAMNSIVGNANLVKKVKFPCEFLPLVQILTATAVFLVGSVVVVIAGLVSGDVHLTAKLLWWPVLVLALVMFAAGVGMMLASANVFIRDVSHLWRVFSQAWFFLSPVFWELRLMRDMGTEYGIPWITQVFVCNPTFPMLAAQRQIFGIGDDYDAEKYAGVYPMGVTTGVLLSLAWGLLALFVGYGFFKSRRHKFADLV